MVALTDALYKRASEFQEKRAEIINVYTNKTNALRGFEGSEAYELRSRKAAEERDNDLRKLRMEYSGYFNTIFDGMLQFIGSMQTKAPTPDQMALLQALMLKKNVKRSELDGIAETCKDTPIVLSILSEIASDKGIAGTHYEQLSDYISGSTAEQWVKSMRSGILDFMNSEKTKASRIQAAYQKDHHGVIVSTKDRPHFKTKDEFFSMLFGLNPEQVAQFDKTITPAIKHSAADRAVSAAEKAAQAAEKAAKAAEKAVIASNVQINTQRLQNALEGQYMANNDGLQSDETKYQDGGSDD